MPAGGADVPRPVGQDVAAPEVVDDLRTRVERHPIDNDVRADREVESREVGKPARGIAIEDASLTDHSAREGFRPGGAMIRRGPTVAGAVRSFGARADGSILYVLPSDKATISVKRRSGRVNHALGRRRGRLLTGNDEEKGADEERFAAQDRQRDRRILIPPGRTLTRQTDYERRSHEVPDP